MGVEDVEGDRSENDEDVHGQSRVKQDKSVLFYHHEGIPHKTVGYLDAIGETRARIFLYSSVSITTP